jgi:hypothetical protein
MRGLPTRRPSHRTAWQREIKRLAVAVTIVVLAGSSSPPSWP